MNIQEKHELHVELHKHLMDAVDCWRIGDIARLAQQLNDALAASEMLLARKRKSK